MDEDLDKDAIGKELAECIAEARELRAARAADPEAEDYPLLKQWQADRLARTYADLLASERYAPAAEFFLSDLYGPKDFRGRDDELARVVPVMVRVRVLPARALFTLLEAVKMDTLSESLDTDMVKALRAAGRSHDIDGEGLCRRLSRLRPARRPRTADRAGGQDRHDTGPPDAHPADSRLVAHHGRPGLPGRIVGAALLPATRLRCLQRNEGRRGVPCHRHHARDGDDEGVVRLSGLGVAAACVSTRIAPIASRGDNPR
jgi:hypothetical protein